MNRHSVLAIAALLSCLAPAFGQTTPQPADTRQLGAHEHGAAKLNIAIEGNKVSMELDTPGDDILGFETVAKTPEQMAIVAAAEKTLSKPADLFVMTAAAGCTATDAKVEIKAGDGGHSDIEAAYTFSCSAPDKLTDVDLKFFKAYPKARKMTVSVITPKGQLQVEATPDKPKISLAGAL